MIRRPPRSTLLTHSFPTLRSSDLIFLCLSMGLWAETENETELSLKKATQAQLITSRNAINRSEEHTAELQSQIRSSYSVVCWEQNTMYEFRRRTLAERAIITRQLISRETVSTLLTNTNLNS